MTARPLWSDRAWLGQPAPAFAAGVQSLLRASQGLTTSGWEISVRLSPERVCLQRLLVGWETRGVSLARKRQLAAEWGIPPTLSPAWQSDLMHAEQVLLAIEGGQLQARADTLERRAYLQFPRTQDNESLVLRGYKWRDEQPDVWRQTDYHRLPMGLAQTQHALRLAMTQDTHDAMSLHAYSAAAEILNNACQRLSQRGDSLETAPFEILVATESSQTGPTPRTSLCMRLYDLDVDARMASEPLQKLLSLWGQAQHGAALRNLLTHRPLGWLATGTDRQGLPFLTLYAQASIHDAWQWTALGAGK